MEKFLGALEIGVPCPGCDHRTKKNLGWLKSHDELVCAGCGETIYIRDHNFQRKLLEAEREIANLMHGQL